MSDKDLRMIFFVRTDLKMPKGKIAAQVGHAVQYALMERFNNEGLPLDQAINFNKWLEGISTKICLKVSSEQELLAWHSLGLENNFLTTLVKDEGLTCFDGVKTLTVVGWGPLTKEEHKEFTKDLSLL